MTNPNTLPIQFFWTKKFILFFNVLLYSLTVFSQDEEKEPVEPEILSITEISKGIETSNKVVKAIEKALLASDQLQKFYKNLPATNDTLTSVLDEMDEEFFLEMSFQIVENTKPEIEGYQTEIVEYQHMVSNRLDLIQTNIATLEHESNKWLEIEKTHRENVSVNTLLKERLMPFLDRIDEVTKNYKEVQKEELTHFSVLNNLENLVNSKSEMLDDQERFLREQLINENLPIWKLGEAKRDSVKFSEGVKKRFRERKIVVFGYFDYHHQGIVFHILIIIAMALFFILTKKHATKLFEDRGYPSLSLFFSKAFASSYIISFLFSDFLYKDFPQVVLEIILVSLIFPVGYLLFEIVNKWQRKVYFFYFALFLVHIGLDLTPLTTFIGRVVYLGYQLLVLGSLSAYLIYFSKIREKNSLSTVVKFFAQIFLLIVLISLILNFLGSFHLSRLMISATIYSCGIGIVLILWNNMLQALAFIMMEIPVIASMKFVKQKRVKLESYIIKIIGISLFLYFLSGVVSQFEIQSVLTDAWNSIVKSKHAFGSVEVSLQDFINFFLVLIITVLLARFLKYLFAQELFKKVKLKRGMPNAVSMTVYYFVLVFGFFLAASSTGIEWSKINLALGAIGVGIGFGLQNVIFNFIAGLILIYERPIQVGDTVELENIMGTVSEIGIRSSKILTYEGSEVIVPNGNLIAKEVINWTYSNQLKRRELIIKTTYSAKPSEVIEAIKGILKESENVLPEPAPMVLFTGFGDGTLDFRILFWAHVDVGLSTSSNAAIKIYNKLLEKGYEMPIQKRVIVVEEKDDITKSKKS